MLLDFVPLPSLRCSLCGRASCVGAVVFFSSAYFGVECGECGFGRVALASVDDHWILEVRDGLG